MKNIVITGASSGIGLATARILYTSGHRLLLISRNPAKLKSLEFQNSERVSVVAQDVTDYEGVKNMASQINHEWGRIDILINNAGVGVFDKVEDGRIEDWHYMVNTNVNGLLNSLHAFLPHLIQSEGHVINIGSVASHQVFMNSGIYSATKHAVFAISEALRIELAGKIKVTTISPGAVNTPFIDQTRTPKMLDEYKDYFAAGLPPEAVAEQILHAISAPGNSVISEIIIRPNRITK